MSKKSGSKEAADVHRAFRILKKLSDAELTCELRRLENLVAAGGAGLGYADWCRLRAGYLVATQRRLKRTGGLSPYTP